MPTTISLPALTLPPLAVYLLASLLNLLWWWRTPDEWAAFCEQSPRLAVLVRASRALGTDLHALFRVAHDGTMGWRRMGVALPDAEEKAPAAPPPRTMATYSPTVDAGALEEQVRRVRASDSQLASAVPGDAADATSLDLAAAAADARTTRDEKSGS